MSRAPPVDADPQQDFSETARSHGVARIVSVAARAQGGTVMCRLDASSIWAAVTPDLEAALKADLRRGAAWRSRRCLPTATSTCTSTSARHSTDRHDGAVAAADRSRARATLRGVPEQHAGPDEQPSAACSPAGTGRPAPVPRCSGVTASAAFPTPEALGPDVPTAGGSVAVSGPPLPRAAGHRRLRRVPDGLRRDRQTRSPRTSRRRCSSARWCRSRPADGPTSELLEILCQKRGAPKAVAAALVEAYAASVAVPRLVHGGAGSRGRSATTGTASRLAEP